MDGTWVWPSIILAPPYFSRYLILSTYSLFILPNIRAPLNSRKPETPILSCHHISYSAVDHYPLSSPLRKASASHSASASSSPSSLTSWPSTSLTQLLKIQFTIAQPLKPHHTAPTTPWLRPMP